MTPRHPLAVVAESISNVQPDDWHYLPALGIVSDQGDGLVQVAGIPLLDPIWSTGEPHQVVDAIATIVEHATTPPPLHGRLVGLILTCSSHQALPPGDTTEKEYDQFMTWLETHDLADHPWGHETRNTFVAGIDGTFHIGSHLRDLGPTDVETWVPGDPGYPTGRLVDALNRLVTVFRNRTDA